MAKCRKCGQRGLGLPLSEDKICYQCLYEAENEKNVELRSKVEDLQSQITPEMVTKNDLEKQIEKFKRVLDDLNASVKEKSAALKALEKQILVASDTVELEDFALYTPKFDFVNSDEFKVRIDEIRAAEKEMIKIKTAWRCPSEWTVDGDRRKGAKMISDAAKMALRAFNNECDIAVSAVKFNTFDRCAERIEKSFEAINKSNQSLRLKIENAYKEKKLAELRLALEWQMKKQEEKEAQRALREQQREEARLAKEIEEARKEAEKEKKHYQIALQKILEQEEQAKTDEERSAIAERKAEIEGELNQMDAKLADIDYRQQNQKAGYVYIISNIGSFGKDVYKIGMTRRLDPTERVDELGDASVPFAFDIHAMIFSSDAPKLEAALHHAFDSKRVNRVNLRREYFRVSLDEIKEVVRANHDKTVEFIEAPTAEQYRESLKIQAH